MKNLIQNFILCSLLLTLVNCNSPQGNSVQNSSASQADPTNPIQDDANSGQGSNPGDEYSSQIPLDVTMAPDEATIELRYYFDQTNGSDSNSCSEQQPCASLSKAVDLVESANSNPRVLGLYFQPGSYGELDWSINQDFEKPVYWMSRNPQVPAQIDGIRLRCDPSCKANQHFYFFNLEKPPTSKLAYVFQATLADHVSLIGSEVHNVHLYTGHAINVESEYAVIANNKIHSIISAIRYSGTHHLFKGNEIFRFPGSGIGMTCGGYKNRVESGFDILVEGNTIYDHIADFPNEPGWENYDEDVELHASLFAIRGANITIRGNWAFNLSDQTVKIQVYDGDCGIAHYNARNILVEENVFYGMGPDKFMQGQSPIGPYIVRQNTIINLYTYVHLMNSAVPYFGEGSEMYNNLIINGGMGGMANFAREHYLDSTALWSVDHNLAHEISYPSATDIHPSNLLVDRLIADNTLPADFYETSVFKKPNYDSFTSVMCAPRGTGNCDWTPLPDSPICTAGRDGKHLGAIPCSN